MASSARLAGSDPSEPGMSAVLPPAPVTFRGPWGGVPGAHGAPSGEEACLLSLQGRPIRHLGKDRGLFLPAGCPSPSHSGTLSV